MPRFSARRRARLCRAGEVLYIPRLSYRLAENRAPGGRRPQRAAAGRHGRPRAAWIRRRCSRAIAEDRAAGAVPVMVVATAGTTGAGMIDPLHACADIAQRGGLWYHVDAAWGGAALASNRLRRLLDGIERADSITIDAHKWLATTMGCAMFITRRGHLLSEAFHASTSFMPSSISGVDPYLNSVQWSRRFLGLRLFLALAAAGWEGLGAHVERGVEVIERVKERLLALGWTHRQRLAAGGAAMPCRRPNWAMCEPWCAAWWPPGAPGWRPPRSRAATWCGSARRTAKPALEDVSALIAALERSAA